MSEWSSIADFPRQGTKIIWSIPASIASSTAYWISGRSTTGSISLGIALVAGRKRVPSPPTGNTALRSGLIVIRSLLGMRADTGRDGMVQCSDLAARPVDKALCAVDSAGADRSPRSAMGQASEMCGINGIFAYHGDAPAIDRDELTRTRDHMAARGPDGTGEWVLGDG